MTLEVASIRGGSRLDSFVVRVVNTSDGTADGHFSAFTSFTIGSGFVAGHEHAGFRCQQRWQQYESDRSPSRSQRDGIHPIDRKSTRLNSSHQIISYAVFFFKKKKTNKYQRPNQQT